MAPLRLEHGKSFAGNGTAKHTDSQTAFANSPTKAKHNNDDNGKRRTAGDKGNGETQKHVNPMTIFM